jgi:hypothetical protein
VLDQSPLSSAVVPACGVHIHYDWRQGSTPNLKDVLGFLEAHCEIWHCWREGDRDSKLIEHVWLVVVKREDTTAGFVHHKLRHLAGF